jgi:hypothetical protein
MCGKLDGEYGIVRARIQVLKMNFQIVFVAQNGEKTNGPLIESPKDPGPVCELNHETWTKDLTCDKFVEFLQNGGAGGPEAMIRALNRHNCWCEALARLKTGQSPNQKLGCFLVSFWITYGISSIPKALKENLVELIEAFKFLLPPYIGPGLTLYRGELESRHIMNVYGISWTPILDVAKMYADRRDDDEGAGVVLKIEATPDMIVASLQQFSDHTSYLVENEYLIDPRTISGRVSIFS